MENDCDKKPLNTFQRYRFYIMPVIVYLLIFFHYVFSGYPRTDSFIIAMIFSLFVVIVYAQHQITKQRKTNGFIEKRVSLVGAFIFGMIALQAAWPTVMPRISIDDANPESGVFFGDKTGTNQYQIVREAIVKVKPPLFPLFDSTYPIANNLRLLGTTRSLNLQIENVDDGQSIKVKLGPVTGWSFDEVTGKIKYQSDGGFNFIVTETNITKLSNNYYPVILDNRENDLPVAVVNLTYIIEKNTSAWNYIHEWVANGSCIRVYFTGSYPKFDHYSSMDANGVSLISKNLWNESIALKLPGISVEPYQLKDYFVVFEEANCKGY